MLIATVADRFANDYPEFELDDDAASFTKRQQDVGVDWIVARQNETEVSFRSHEGGFSDVCVYDHSDGEEIDDAVDALRKIKTLLTQINVSFEQI